MGGICDIIKKMNCKIFMDFSYIKNVKYKFKWHNKPGGKNGN
jgi:hypothetical protein